MLFSNIQNNTAMFCPKKKIYIFFRQKIKAFLILYVHYHIKESFTNDIFRLTTVLRVRRDIGDNPKIIFCISQQKYML